MRRMRCATALVIGLLGCSSNDRSVQSLAPDDAIAWLPADTETLQVATQPFFLPAPDEDERADGVLALETAVVGLPFYAISKGLPAKSLSGNKILLAVEGSRRFRAPGGLGLMLYEGCHIIVFEESVAKTFETLRASAAGTGTIEGRALLTFTEKIGTDDTWKILVAMAGPNVLLVGTEENFMKEVLGRATSRSPRVAFPASLSEWKSVNKQSPCWGMRHYRPETAATDPSSPLAGRGLDGNVVDGFAKGFGFECDPEDPNILRLTFYSENRRIAEIAREMFTFGEGHVVPKIEEDGGSVHITIDMKSARKPSDITWCVGAWVGHGIYL